jgi:hypothetical protein
MVRNGYTRRLLAALLVLLTVTPQSLWRSCCCTRNQALAAETQQTDAAEDVALATTDEPLEGLSPCCQERVKRERLRIQAAQLAAAREAGATYQISSSQISSSQIGSSCCHSDQASLGNSQHLQADPIPHLNDSHNCCCRATSETARVERLVFRHVDLKSFVLPTAVDTGFASLLAESSIRFSSNESTAEFRLRPECVQLCRWIV